MIEGRTKDLLIKIKKLTNENKLSWKESKERIGEFFINIDEYIINIDKIKKQPLTSIVPKILTYRDTSNEIQIKIEDKKGTILDGIFLSPSDTDYEFSDELYRIVNRQVYKVDEKIQRIIEKIDKF